MRRQADVDVAVRRVLDDIALGKGGAGRPVPAIDADLLRDGQFARAVECEDLVGPGRRRDREFCGTDRVGARCLDRASQRLFMLLNHEGQLVERIFHQLRGERVVGNQVEFLDQILLTQNGNRLTNRRSRQHSDVPAAGIADTADRVMRRDGLDRLGAVGRADDDGQIVLVKDLERVGEDRGGSVAVV